MQAVPRTVDPAVRETNIGQEKDSLGDGCGREIGHVTALSLARDGWTVVLTGRKAGPLTELASQIEIAGGQATARPTDVTLYEEVIALFDFIRQRFARLDPLFNDAGSFVPFESLTPEQWRDVVDVNLTDASHCAQSADAPMKSQSPQGGRIINNGSVSAMPRDRTLPHTRQRNMPLKA